MNLKKILIDIKSTKFVLNWASGSMLLGAIIWAVTMTIQNNNLKAKIDPLIESKKTLTKTVNTLVGSQQTVNSVIKQFMDNPPGVLDYKIEELKKEVEKYHEIPNHTGDPAGDFPDRIPEN